MTNAEIIARIVAKISSLKGFYKNRKFSLKGEVAFSYQCDSCGKDGICIPLPGNKFNGVPPKYCEYCGTIISQHSNIKSHSLYGIS